jgi:hypothetical protein
MSGLIELPKHVTHYYRIQPFRTLTALDDDARAVAIGGLEFPPEASHRFHSKYYFEQRLRYEQLMYKQFLVKGGRPTRRHPHYAILGESEIWKNITTHAVRIPLSEIPSIHISFTYTDSWVTYVEREPNGDPIPRKPQYGMLFRKEELGELFGAYGWPGERWKTEPDWKNDLYVEAQIWSDESVLKHCPLGDTSLSDESRHR